MCERYGVAELSLFGSVARGTATEPSDVDVLYVMPLTARLNLAIDAIDAGKSFAAAATRPEIRRGAVAVGLFASVVTVQWARFERRVALAARSA